MIAWAIHDGGYDADTWYWGALVLLATLAAVVAARGSTLRAMSRSTAVALVALALYVAWSYLSIQWAQSRGDALQGSNRALLYLIAFALMAVLPWTTEAALVALLTFVLGVGAIAFVLLYRLGSGDQLSSLVIDGRLAAPTGYFNSTAALFTLAALTAIVLCTRRELPALLRGCLTASACAGLQLAVVVQSRGWLFTLPLIALVAIVIVPDRLRVAAAAVLPVLAALIPLRRLLHVYGSSPGLALDHAARRAGQAALLVCAAMFVVATVVAWAEGLSRRPPLSKTARKAIGSVVASAALAAAVVGGVAATHGHPLRFISRQWHGFSQPIRAYSAGSHFTDVGSGRYDFWRVSLKAFAAHPIGGLGQDNYGDYYVRSRRTGEEPSWTHSLEMRLLVHTGVVGALLFAAFLIAALAAALGGRRQAERPLARAAAGAAMIPMTVWLIHGSVDWFWEIPALTAPALGFLAIAAALRRAPREQPSVRAAGQRGVVRIAVGAGATIALLASAGVLAFPYLSTRKLSLASDVQQRDPAAALAAVADAARLDPLSAAPGRLGGMIALRAGWPIAAEHWFRQASGREPGGWLAWLGDGLAASALGDSERAHRDFVVAASINAQQPAIKQALARVYTTHPLTPGAALGLLVLVH